MTAVSGMTLVVVPARILATVTTAGLNASTLRVTMVWNAPTISQAIGMGSTAWCGMDAWPPLPVTVTVKKSAEASSGPGRVPTKPDGADGVWWMAKARVTGSAEQATVEQALVEHDLGPGEALLTGLEHEHDPTGQLVPPGGEQPRPRWRAWRCGRRGRRRAWPRRSPTRTRRPVSSGIGSASMSPRRSTVGPGRPLSRVASTHERLVPGRDRRDRGPRWSRSPRPASRADGGRAPGGGGAAGAGRWSRATDPSPRRAGHRSCPGTLGPRRICRQPVSRGLTGRRNFQSRAAMAAS